VRDQLLSLFAHTTNNNYSGLVFTLFSVICSILVVFAVCSDNNDVYAQQSSPHVPVPTPLLQSSQQANTSDTNVPIVLRPLPGGTCPEGYHLVSGTVCIKDLPSAALTKTTPAPTPTIPATTNTTNAFSTPLSSTTQPNDTNPSNGEENFGTKILKSFNREFK
jgi:hypothetical protein